MMAFHGDPAIKAKYIARVRQHREADELIRGTGWDGHRGCAIGCTLDRYDHLAYETELGIPATVAHLEDAIFEGLAFDRAMEWPERFLSAIRPSANLWLVSEHWMVWFLEVELQAWASEESAAVCALYRRRIAGDEPTPIEWNKAETAARVAAAMADRERRWAARAAEMAEAAAREAARAEGPWLMGAAWAATWLEEEKAARMADKLIELLEAA